MTLYSVYARPDHAPVLVADRFSWFAALLPPVYAIVHRLWLVLLAWVAAMAAIGVAAQWIGGEAAFWCVVLAGIFCGFEAPAARHRAMLKRGFAHAADLVGASEDTTTLEFLRQK